MVTDAPIDDVTTVPRFQEPVRFVGAAWPIQPPTHPAMTTADEDADAPTIQDGHANKGVAA